MPSRKQRRNENTLVLLITTLHQEIAELSSLVKSQSAIIQQMQTQIEILTTTSDMSATEAKQVTSGIATQISKMAEFFGCGAALEDPPTNEVAPPAISSHDALAVDGAPRSDQSMSPSNQGGLLQARRKPPAIATYATVAAKFTDSVVIAMHVDQAERRQRASSVIVSGLAESTSVSDIELFADLCTTELGISADISLTKRLGREMQGKVKPLLVQLKDVSQAQLLINSAKQLRHSSKPEVRDAVYINANLTKAESLAAFQVREKRRQNVTLRQGGGSAGRVVGHTFYRSYDLPPIVPPNSNAVDVQAAGVCPSAAVPSALCARAAAFVPASAPLAPSASMDVDDGTGARRVAQSAHLTSPPVSRIAGRDSSGTAADPWQSVIGDGMATGNEPCSAPSAMSLP